MRGLWQRTAIEMREGVACFLEAWGHSSGLFDKN